MADKIVQLIDKDGDNIFPVTVSAADNTVTTAMLQNSSVTTAKLADGSVTTNKIADENVTTAKIADGSVTTAKIADGNITSAKFSQYTVNVAIKTGANLSPAEDTPTGWKNLINKSGFFVTRYNTLSKFTNQPSQYGELVTINNSADIIQCWLQYTLPARYRYGNAAGWKNGAQDGTWDVFIDHRSIGTFSPVLVASSTSSTFLASGDNLQNNTFCQPGNYCARNNTIAGSLLNAPTNKAFKMIVINTLSSGTTVTPEVGQSIYLIRMAITYTGDIYVQYVANNNTASWSFSAWKHIFDSSNAITEIQANGTSVATSGVANIPAASTSAYGVTKLSSSTSSTSTALAATASAVKSAYDLANGKAKITCQTTDPGTGASLAANNFIAVYTA